MSAVLNSELAEATEQYRATAERMAQELFWLWNDRGDVFSFSGRRIKSLLEQFDEVNKKVDGIAIKLRTANEGIAPNDNENAIVCSSLQAGVPEKENGYAKLVESMRQMQRACATLGSDSHCSQKVLQDSKDLERQVDAMTKVILSPQRNLFDTPAGGGE